MSPYKRKDWAYIYTPPAEPSVRYTLEDYEAQFGALPAHLRESAEVVIMRGGRVVSVELERFKDFGAINGSRPPR